MEGSFLGRVKLKVRPPRDKGEYEGSACMRRGMLCDFGENGECRERGNHEVVRIGFLAGELIDFQWIVDGTSCFFFSPDWRAAVGYRQSVGHATAPHMNYVRAAA